MSLADSRAGVGGDWFDVIPLSGTRVALVIGDVTGHGIHAAAMMRGGYAPPCTRWPPWT